MELRQLRTFVGVVEAGSLLKASARLHVAQPALGQQIAALEHSLGARLFTRSSRGMHLTAAGRTFLDHARVLLADAERARAAVRGSAATPQGEVVIGLPTTIALVATVPLVQAARERLPQVRLRVVEAYSGFVREWLQTGRLDLAVLYGDQPEPTIAKRALLDEGLALITAPGPLPAAPGRRAGAARRSAGARLSLRQVARHELVLPGREHGLRRIIDEACAAQALVPRVVAEIDSLPNVKRAVESGIGATILPLAAVSEEVAAGRLCAAPITDASMQRRVVLATSVTRPSTLAGDAVAALAVELIGAMVRDGAWPGRWLDGAPR